MNWTRFIGAEEGHAALGRMAPKQGHHSHLLKAIEETESNILAKWVRATNAKLALNNSQA
jgi:hypothetical protein